MCFIHTTITQGDNKQVRKSAQRQQRCPLIDDYFDDIRCRQSNHRSSAFKTSCGYYTKTNSTYIANFPVAGLYSRSLSVKSVATAIRNYTANTRTECNRYQIDIRCNTQHLGCTTTKHVCSFLPRDAAMLARSWES